MAHKGLIFGIFLAPFHRAGDNPTLAIARDMELIEWLDHLGYDEAWIGEHHSAGWELIASPELVIAAAAERTKNIRLGSGVTSLPYHHPLLVANRFVQLDHMTRGRAMLGCGPGALVSDAYMLAIEASTQRRRMDELLDAITRLLKCEEPVTMKTDWFEMREARLHLAPYTDPHFTIAVASTQTPAGMHCGGQVRPRRPVAGRRHSRRAGGAGQAVDDRRGRGGQARPNDGPSRLAPRHQHAHGRGRRAGAARGACRRAHRDGDLFRGDAGASARTRRRSAARRRQDGHHLGRLARDGGEGHRAADRAEQGRHRRRHVPRARMGQPRGHHAQLRAVRALGDAALPGLARHRDRLARLGPRQPQDHLRAQRARRSRRPTRMPASRCRRTTRCGSWAARDDGEEK